MLFAEFQKRCIKYNWDYMFSKMRKVGGDNYELDYSSKLNYDDPLLIVPALLLWKEAMLLDKSKKISIYQKVEKREEYLKSLRIILERTHTSMPIIKKQIDEKFDIFTFAYFPFFIIGTLIISVIGAIEIKQNIFKSHPK
jgi:hypothetical protein